MTRESVLSFVDRHVRISHGGPTYVRVSDPHGILVGVSDTQVLLRDPSGTNQEPCAWPLDTIAQITLLDAADGAPLDPR